MSGTPTQSWKKATHRLADNLANDSVVRSTNDTHDMEELILVIPPAEQGDASNHLRKDTSAGPDIDRCAVRAGTQQHVGSTIP